jgi:uncharacterized protein involved in outer membrane biogenesis
MARSRYERRSRPLRVVLFALVATVVLLVGAGAAFVLTVNPNNYKPQIVAAVASATGRQITINGNISYSLSLQPTLEVNDVAVSNPPGFSRPEMVTLKTLEVQVALLPLLSRRVEVKRLVLVQPNILLETNPQGQTNWSFAPPVPGALSPTAPQNGAASPSPAAPPVQLASLRIENGVLAMRDAGGHVRSIDLRRVDMSAPASDAEVHLTADAVVNGLPLSVSGETGPLRRLREQATAASRWPLRLSIEAAGSEFGIDGTIAQPALGQGVALAVMAKVPDLSALTPLVGVVLPTLGDIALHFQVRDGAHAHAFDVNHITLTTPQLDVSGSASFANGTPPTVTADLTSNRIDLDALAAASTRSHGPALGGGQGTSHLAAPVTNSHGIIPDVPLPIDELKALNSDVTLAVAALRTGKVDYRNLKLHATNKQGQLTVEPIEFDAPGGHIAAKLTANANASPPPIELTLRAPSLALQPLLSAMGKPGYASGIAEVRADLSGRGTTPRAIAASLDGGIGVAVADGEIDTQLLRNLTSWLFARTELAKFAPKAGLGKLNCFAARLDTANGIGTFRALLLDTDTLVVNGSGQLNLRSETIDMRLRPSAGVSGTNITVPLKVSGTFATPSVQPDPAAALMENAGTAAKMALGAGTGGIGLIIGSVIGSKTGGNACAGALALARFSAAPAEAPPASGTGAPAVPAPAKPSSPAQLLKKLFR